MIVILWIILSIVCGVLGNDRSIGAVGAFFIALLLSPIIGFIVVFASDRKPLVASVRSKWKQLTEEAEIEKYKGNITSAIDKYKEAMYYLEKEIATNSNPAIKPQLTDRFDGLKMIVKKLETEVVK
jgi:hypothetical protein